MTNKGAKQLLEMIYGKGCMFIKADIPKRLKGTNIKGYRQFVGELHYKSRKIILLEKNLTYHHLKHRSEGGETSLENGAIIGELPHRYIHSLPREQEEIINNMLREYKESFVLKGGIWIPTERDIILENPFERDIEEDSEFITIELQNITPEIEKKRYNRAKNKRELRKISEEAIYDYFEGEDRDED